MCPLWPFHFIILYLLMILPLGFLTWGTTIQAVKNLPIRFDPSSVKIQMGQMMTIQVYSDDPDVAKHKWLVETEHEKNYVINFNKTYLVNTGDNKHWTSTFNISGNFLGKTEVKLKAVSDNEFTYKSTETLGVTVVKEKRVIDKVFTYSVVILVSVLYINFGCALDWEFIKETLKRPIGPFIGFLCQFLFMPLFGYGFGKLLFPDVPEMQLGLFFTGLSPGGGASNIWSVALEANVDLSIAMTMISSIAAFGMIPFWLVTVGHNIFQEAKLSTPYTHIAHYVICLIVPLAVGFAVQRFLPKLSKILVRLLKPFSLSLIVFIILFASITNSYIFSLFTWQIVVAGLSLPWLGYFIGYLTAWFCGQPFKNIMAIAIETGVQNTAIAIFMLRFSLGQPAADITTVIPVAVSVMTPIPLAIVLIISKIRSKRNARNAQKKSLLVKQGILNGLT